MSKKSSETFFLFAFLAEWGIFIFFITAFLLSRIYIWSPVSVDGHSMDPTLQDQEKLLMIKTSSIQRFDIVVASETDANGDEKLIVKRVIGMPGDTIRYENDVLYVNDKEVDEPYLNSYKAAFAKDKLQSTYSYKKQFQEVASNASAFTVDSSGNSSFSVTVADGEYFLLGDDRLVSKDSRYVGNFKAEAIEGEIIFRIWPINRIGTVD
ncbi:TPA: signal peptidase I [Streptococcus suis]|nr:signal peptidase I [Streptococcus suis]MBY5021264.1 signal peptidase I [Streptococcus suis]MCQ8265296.1 signal peptidase I [Streptococcus suis]HEL1583901.1 signal peptidase I [Streptococcus suis]HEL1639505.1 signal peptidase I [Streptococcus suis]